jgi:hypothetical protein
VQNAHWIRSSLMALASMVTTISLVPSWSALAEVLIERWCCILEACRMHGLHSMMCKKVSTPSGTWRYVSVSPQDMAYSKCNFGMTSTRYGTLP